MFSNPEQFANATRMLFEFQLETFNVLTSKTIQGVEQVVALNVDTAKNAVAGSLARVQNLSTRAPQDLLSGPQAPNGIEDAAEYQRQLAVIVANIQQEFAEAAEAHIAEAKNNLSALIQDVTTNVRPGSENAVAIVKTAIENAFNGCEQVTRATRQAVTAVEQQVSQATEQLNRNLAQAARAGNGTGADGAKGGRSRAKK